MGALLLTQEAHIKRGLFFCMECGTTILPIRGETTVHCHYSFRFENNQETCACTAGFLVRRLLTNEALR